MFFVRRDGAAELGPIALADLQRMVADGRVRSTDLVREESWTSWRMAGELPELQAVFAMPPAGAAPQVPPYAGSSAGTAVEPLVPLRRAEMGLVILFSIITLGIYGMVWFYGVMRSYRSIAQRPGSSSDTLFWVYVSCVIAGFLLSWIYIGFAIYVAAIVVGAILLSNVLQDREVAASRIGGIVGLNSSGTHMTLWLAAEILTVTCFGAVLGIPLAIVQAILFISDHNRVVDEFLNKQPSMVAR